MYRRVGVRVLANTLDFSRCRFTLGSSILCLSLVLSVRALKQRPARPRNSRHGGGGGWGRRIRRARRMFCSRLCPTPRSPLDHAKPSPQVPSLFSRASSSRSSPSSRHFNASSHRRSSPRRLRRGPPFACPCIYGVCRCVCMCTCSCVTRAIYSLILDKTRVTP